MEALNTLLALLSKTQGRDKILRLIQYATVQSTQSNTVTPTKNVYNQIRNTRKVLRFLRTLQYSKKIREDIPKLKSQFGNHLASAHTLTAILKNLSTFLFFLSDHRVLLSQLKVIDPSNHAVHYPRSYLFYFLQNVFGVIHNILEIMVVLFQGKYNGQMVDMDSGPKIIKLLIVDAIKCFLDLFIALFYWKKTISAKKAAVIGTITSIISIVQCIK